jgi:hypothetical protein
MRGSTPFHLYQLTDMPALPPLTTDTAHPNLPVPIYFIHSLERPFCKNPGCKCQWQQQEVRRLLSTIVEGEMTLREAADFLDEANGERK